MTQPVLHFYDIDERVTAFSTTRQGGYSQGLYGEFNINSYCGDDVEAIRRNRLSLCTLLGINDDCLLMPHQVHLTKVATISKSFLHLSANERKQQLEGVDALMTDVPGVCIGVSTADCIPILLYDPRHHVSCAIHAGWRGTVARIVLQAIISMAATYGTQPSDLIAQIGPGISLDSFEVGNEVYEAFAEARFDMSAISEYRDKWHIDLPLCNRLQLIEAGVPASHIDTYPVCTFQHSDNYFSARRLGIQSGRIFTAIMLR